MNNKESTDYERKLKLMRDAAMIVGHKLSLREVDLLYSMFHLVEIKGGDTDLESISKVIVEIDDRESMRQKQFLTNT